MQGHRQAANLVNDYIYPFYQYCTKTKAHKVPSLHTGCIARGSSSLPLGSPRTAAECGEA